LVSLLRLAVLVEGGDVGPEVLRLRLVLDAGERHLGAGDLGLDFRENNAEGFEARLSAGETPEFLKPIELGPRSQNFGVAHAKVEPCKNAPVNFS
jgi:hypothetical protein